MVETYRIRIGGRLDGRWMDWFEGLALERGEDATTVLVGPIDQAALHGIFARIRDLGLPVLSVNRVDECGDAEETKGDRE